MRPLLLALGGLVLLSGPVAADCRGAELLAPAGPVEPGGRLVVDARALLPCDDTGPGCRGPRGGLDDVELVLEQDGRSRVLDVRDADGEGRARFRAVLPADLAPGPATLRAYGAELAITVAPAR